MSKEPTKDPRKKARKEERKASARSKGKKEGLIFLPSSWVRAQRGPGEGPLAVDVDGLDHDLILAVLPQPGHHEPGALAVVVVLVHVEEPIVRGPEGIK